MINNALTATRWKPSLVFFAFGAIAAVIASTAAVTSLHLGMTLWAMFIGWVAYFTRPVSTRQGICTWICVLGGLSFGVGARFALQRLLPAMGSFALFVVFTVAIVVVSMRNVRVLDNIPAWFPGLIAFSHRMQGFEVLVPVVETVENFAR
jgi:hypothetical protein